MGLLDHNTCQVIKFIPGNMRMGMHFPMFGRSLTLLPNLQIKCIIWIHCHSEMQLKQELRRFLRGLCDADLNEFGTSHASEMSNLFLRSLMIGMGSCHIYSH
ncbi:hypothetical protein MTR_8g012260 [Medicago truncatula]|uniref:Uncharacterized protein n=1 Tax=Medicago truncatula TaxID=3880 RepID=G7LF53_MEDTR|nr:hypothetical protein MTR_8g012260 [Medicago truncatula]